MSAVRFVAPLLILLFVAGHALAGSPPAAATASHAPEGAATVERIAAFALAALLVLGLFRLQRHKK